MGNIVRLIVTGGAGFIGSAVIRKVIGEDLAEVLNIDALTYAGNLESLQQIAGHGAYSLSNTNLRDRATIDPLLTAFKPTAVMHLAAESHVDRSIDGPADFIETNIVGTYNLLEAVRAYWQSLPPKEQQDFRFHHISTDEVYGSLGEDGLFTENTAYQPNSPYSASKASADHLVRAWHHTFGLPVVTTNCSNNYGPYQFPEKLIPLVILNGLAGKPLPIYGKGNQIRDWLYVDDHVEALWLVLNQGRVGETYNIGGCNEKTNLEVVKLVCELLDELAPSPDFKNGHQELITFVADRPGHDQRYAIDTEKINQELGWCPAESFTSGLRKTVSWYLENRTGWCQRVSDGSYRGQRLGLSLGN